MTQIEKVISQIQSEFRLNNEGKAFVSIRGAARLADVDATGLSRSLTSGVDQSQRPLAAFLIEQGFEGVDLIEWANTGIPDTALALILSYYAHEAQERYRTQQAKLCCYAFQAIGIRSWIQQQLQLAKQETANSSISIAETILMIGQQLVDQERRTTVLEERTGAIETKLEVLARRGTLPSVWKAKRQEETDEEYIIRKLVETSQRAEERTGSGWVKAKQFAESFSKKRRPSAEAARHWMQVASEKNKGQLRGEGQRLQFHWM